MVRKHSIPDDFNLDDYINPVRRSKVINEVIDDAILDDAERSDKVADKDIASSNEMTNILPQVSEATASSAASEIGEECISGADTTDSVNEAKSKVTPPTKRILATTSKQSFEEYHKLYLQVPKINNGKPIFISDDLREKLYEVTIRLGGRKMSPSGFVENLLRHHMETYGDDWEKWLNK